MAYHPSCLYTISACVCCCITLSHLHLMREKRRVRKNSTYLRLMLISTNVHSLWRMRYVVKPFSVIWCCVVFERWLWCCGVSACFNVCGISSKLWGAVMLLFPLLSAPLVVIFFLQIGEFRNSPVLPCFFPVSVGSFFSSLYIFIYNRREIDMDIWIYKYGYREIENNMNI